MSATDFPLAADATVNAKRRALLFALAAAPALVCKPGRVFAARTFDGDGTMNVPSQSAYPVQFKSQRVDDVDVFYREAGAADAPVILLLHGFPTSSHMFRNLMPALASRYRLIAPDLPGFGQTQAPPRGQFEYTFDNLARVIEGFTDALQLTRYTIYAFDYGAPTGYRLAAAHPERVSAIISQNGNAYLEGFGDRWGAWQAYWREPTEANREACRDSLSPETIKNWQYGTGANPSLLSPDGYACGNTPERQDRVRRWVLRNQIRLRCRGSDATGSSRAFTRGHVRACATETRRYTPRFPRCAFRARSAPYRADALQPKECRADRRMRRAE